MCLTLQSSRLQLFGTNSVYPDSHKGSYMGRVWLWYVEVDRLNYEFTMMMEIRIVKRFRKDHFTRERGDLKITYMNKVGTQ